MNNNSFDSRNLHEDAVDREDLARSNVTHANIFRNAEAEDAEDAK